MCLVREKLSSPSVFATGGRESNARCPSGPRQVSRIAFFLVAEKPLPPMTRRKLSNIFSHCGHGITASATADGRDGAGDCRKAPDRVPARENDTSSPLVTSLSDVVQRPGGLPGNTLSVLPLYYLGTGIRQHMRPRPSWPPSKST